MRCVNRSIVLDLPTSETNMQASVQKQNWSEKSPKKFVGAMKDIHDFCIASVEIASLVDIGHPLVCETYIYESEQPGAFTVWEGITKNRALFAQDIDWFAKEITLLS